MNLLRKILFPLAAIYGIIMWVRNYFYDRGIFASTEFDVPVIVVGNLSVGGTGKTPQIEYLIRLLLPHFRVATLSRGYKRKSTGFILADITSTAETIGDEPFQFYTKFPAVRVAVDADRVNGISNLVAMDARPEVILLDDAFQHRRVKARVNILLTSFNDLYSDDFVLPTGNLREGRRNANRAQIIIVTKCPEDMSATSQMELRNRLNPGSGQQLFFSYVEYDHEVHSEVGSLSVRAIRPMKKVLLAGIAKPEPFFDYLNNGSDLLLRFSDHHNFTERELLEISDMTGDRLIITTEKDFMRLRGRIPSDQLYYLPIRSKFISDGEQFDKTILDYVGQSTTDCRIS